jgi:DNA-binding response OmpR family regulator
MDSAARHFIWVIDDDRDVRDSLKDYLEIEGFDVKTFADGAAAWSAVERGDARPSAIILDHDMPRMDGREFRRRQLERDDVANVPVLVFTASGPLIVPGALAVSKSTSMDALVVTLRAACADAADRDAQKRRGGHPRRAG